MTTYTTPHFATGLPDRNVRSESSQVRPRPATAATYRTAGVSDEAAALADGPTPDWQPGASSKGVPKAAIGALGAALVGGVALAIVLLAPSNKVTKPVLPDPVAQAAATAKAPDATAAATEQMTQQPPAAGITADAPAAVAVPAPVQAVIPSAPPVANAAVARVPRHAPEAVATPRVAPQPKAAAPVVTPDVPAAAVTPPADVQPPAMQQTPPAPTVAPSDPSPAPAATPDTPPPAPAQ